MSNTSDFLSWHVEQARIQQRAGDFISRSKNSISLSGKTVESIISCTDKNRLHEIVLIEDEMNVERFEGDGVTEEDVFASSENAVWEGDRVRFLADGLLLTANQYEYLQKYGPLSQCSYFGRTNNLDSTVMKTWRDISRKAFEARRDKAKDILYLSFGSVTWTKEEATATAAAERVTSPLLLCPITAAWNSKDRPRFSISSEIVRINGILQRELKQRNVDLFVNVSPDLRFGSQVTDALKTIGENARYCYDIEVDLQDLNVAILDSTNESICQLIEKNKDRLATAPLIRLFAGEIRYEEMPVHAVSSHAIYPLPADDSQREVIEMICAGHSVYVAAAAGTGKSQTMVNAAANLCIHGKKLLVMSEKAAANKVFIKYSHDIGLDRFCLVLDNKITVPQLVDQLDRIVNQSRVYLDPIRSRDLLSETAEIEETFAEYNRAVYEVIPEIDMTLYELIGEAIACAPAEHRESITVDRSAFRTACRRLDDLQSDIDNTVSEEDLTRFIAEGSTGDEEMDEILTEPIEGLLRIGTDLCTFIKENGTPCAEIARTVKANLARLLAESLVKEKGIEKFGNLVLRNKYSKLTSCYSRLRSLYSGYLQQQLGKQVAEAVSANGDLIPLLERIKTSKMGVLDFFKKYGAAVLQICPIIVTTPSAAVNYVTDEMNSFDAILLDEASQVPIISVLPFLTGERQLIACGDQNQLDITGFFHTNKNDNYNDEGEYDISRSDKSLLHLVQGKGIPSKRLLYHYRSKTQHLVTVSNALCYNGMLNVVPDVYTGWDKLPSHLGFELCRIDEPFDPVAAQASAVKKKGKNRITTEYPYLDQHTARVENKMATTIAERVASIRDETPEKSIGIITLNDSFHDKVLDALERLDIETMTPTEDGGYEETVWCRSLENTQGEESDIAIIAIEHDRRNVKGILQKNISGFFNGGEQTEQSGNNRLNVLFTRAREKNIIYVPFDYNEIRNSERSLKRLFTYLEYAATGNMSCNKEEIRTEDVLNRHAAAAVAEAIGSGEVRGKVGHGTLMVDIGAMAAHDAPKYDVGFLIPDRNLTANALCTKVNLLERAGWRVLPISLVYLLEKPEYFKSQLPSMIGRAKALGSVESENLLIASCPSIPVTLEEIARRGMITDVELQEEEKPQTVSRITPAELAAEGIETICRLVCDEEIRDASQEVIDGSFRVNTQAFLIKLAQITHKHASEGNEVKLNDLPRKVYHLYKNMGERRACYLLAQLLRLSSDCDSEGNQQMIRELMEQARALHIVK